MDDAIVRDAKKRHRLLVGEYEAEAAKLSAGSVWPAAEDAETEIRGRDIGTGFLRRATVTGAELREALLGPVGQIVEAVKSTLERAPAELAADVMETGIVLVGGGSLLRGMDELLRHETNLATTIVESPLTCVAVGAGMSLEEPALEASRAQRRRRRRFRA